MSPNESRDIRGQTLHINVTKEEVYGKHGLTMNNSGPGWSHMKLLMVLKDQFISYTHARSCISQPTELGVINFPERVQKVTNYPPIVVFCCFGNHNPFFTLAGGGHCTVWIASHSLFTGVLLQTILVIH